jgi:hypothetical protein
MKLKVQEVGKGFYPQEVLVEIRSAAGAKKMLIDKRALLSGNYVTVGSPIDDRDDNFLVELPRETVVGEWRVWVPRDQLAAG